MMAGIQVSLDLSFVTVQSHLFEWVPELKRPYEEKFGQDYDLARESPGQYPLFEDVVDEFLREVLRTQGSEDLLARMFGFFEEMARSNDRDVTDLLGIAILESLVYEPERYGGAKRYMGPKTLKFAEFLEHTRKKHMRERM